MRNIALSIYQSVLLSRLKASTLVAGTWHPSKEIRNAAYIGVIVGGKPAILCGPHDDPESIKQAARLAAIPDTKKLLHVSGYHGEVAFGVVLGSEVEWQDKMTVLVSKPAGHIEDGTGKGAPMSIVLNDPHAALATAICINTATARAVDPDAPEMGDMNILAALARA